MLQRFVTCMIGLCSVINIHAQQNNSSAGPDPEYMNQLYYVEDSNKLVSLEKEKATMKTKTKLGGFGGASSAYVMEGSSSTVKLGKSKPSFAVKIDANMMMMDPSSMLRLYKFDKKKDTRESIISKSGFGGKNNSVNTDGISCTIKKTSTGVYIVSPEEPLEPGEYAFLNMMQMAGSGMNMAYTAYAFSIN